MDEANLKARFEELNLVKTNITMYSGHAVYESQTGAGNYIISGSMLVRYVNGDVEPSLYDYLREESGTRRIRVYDTEEEVARADRLQGEGRALLEGVQAPAPRAIVLNGSLVEDAEYSIDHEDRLLVTVEQVFAAYAYNAGYTPGVGAVIPFNYTGYFFPSRHTSPDYQEIYHVAGGQWTYTSSDNDNFWTDTFDCIWDGGRIEMETLTRILGWTCQIQDGMLVITSCPEDMYPINVYLTEAQFQDYDVYYPEDVSLLPKGSGRDASMENGGEMTTSDDAHESESLPRHGEG